MSFFAVLHVLVYSAGTLRGGGARVAVARSASGLLFPAKGRAEPAHTRRPPPHSASPCSAHQLVYSFLPTLSVVPPGRGPPRAAPFPPVRVRIRSSASHPLIITSSLPLARSSDRVIELPCAVPAAG
ncbi:hypothetical protein GQ55_9G086400 [Panicum hallii var. hallii]|uniref:Secreted protein n=1 Tax=Panicum hallii var. hallii TaxID=1504633 RepID=A0A2T7C121_9POAL|nr:hypothetical protein GQ55_9G086400 [Panicum hallii var. hallii]